jgi:type VI secretion system secreted protein VgrG
MQDVGFYCKDAPFVVTELRGEERLGQPSSFTLELVSSEPLDPASLLGEPCVLRLVSELDERLVHGIVFEATALGTAQQEAARRYRIEMRSAHVLLELRRQTRVFQHMSLPDVIAAVLEAAGLGGERLERKLGAEHAAREYLTQYAETDAAFIRRICEDEGLYFHFEPREGFDALVLEDSSSSAPKALGDPLALVGEHTLRMDRPAAFRCTGRRQRRVGKVTLRDYDPEKPALLLEAVAEGGKPLERAAEVYFGAGGFKTPSAGNERAKRRLESLRAEARTYRFRTNVVSPRPGHALGLEVSEGYDGPARPEEELFVLAVAHRWRRGHELATSGAVRDTPDETGQGPGVGSESSAEASAEPERVFEITAIPLKVPYRLPRMIPRPKISGIHSAIVTGASGEEIHVDSGGHIKVRFPWDRFGPSDDKSSLPVRVLQPSLPGPMLIPRVGWEVMCAFEDGDPDRSYVLGRTYNAKWPPPVALPAKKTMTLLGTASSPGGGARNVVSFHDAAGRQHMVWAAGLGKTTTVGTNMLVQTVGFEHLKVDGAQTVAVSGNETISVKNAMRVHVGSQIGTVGGSQNILINAEGATTTGSEAVSVGGSLIEIVGNPASGLKNFAQAAVLAGVGQIPHGGEAVAALLGGGKALAEGYAQGGMDGLKLAAGQQAAGLLAGKVPGGDALLAAADGAGHTPWSDKAREAKGQKEKGGGAGGPGGGGAGGAGAAPGHRKTIVDGAMGESIGAVHSITTPGSIKWTSLGVASYAIGGAHATEAVSVGFTTLGASGDTAAAVSLTAAASIGRTVKGAMKTTVGGSLTESAGGKHDVKANGPLSILVGGALSATGGSVVFHVGGSVVAVHGGGVLMKSPSITVNGAATQSGKTSSD